MAAAPGAGVRMDAADLAIRARALKGHSPEQIIASGVDRLFVGIERGEFESLVRDICADVARELDESPQHARREYAAVLLLEAQILNITAKLATAESLKHEDSAQKWYLALTRLQAEARQTRRQHAELTGALREPGASERPVKIVIKKGRRDKGDRPTSDDAGVKG